MQCSSTLHPMADLGKGWEHTVHLTIELLENIWSVKGLELVRRR